MLRYDVGSTYQKPFHQIFGLLIKPVGERVVKLFDFLPISETAENKATRDHLIDDASQGPEI